MMPCSVHDKRNFGGPWWHHRVVLSNRQHSPWHRRLRLGTGDKNLELRPRTSLSCEVFRCRHDAPLRTQECPSGADTWVANGLRTIHAQKHRTLSVRRRVAWVWNTEKAADVRRFAHAINKDEVLGTHKGARTLPLPLRSAQVWLRKCHDVIMLL